MPTRTSRRVAALVATFTLFASSAAHANPEPTATYDARAAGMAGTAVGYIDSAVALFHNPAGLAHIPRYSLALVSDILVVRYNVPFAGPGSEIDSPPIIAPLPFLGGAGRISRRLVIGGGIYVTTGFGGTFKNIPRVDDYTPRAPVSCANKPIGSDCGEGPVTQSVDNQTVTLFVVEGAVAAGVKVLDTLRLGLSLRVPFTAQSASAMQETQAAMPSTAGWQYVKQSVSGFGLPAILFGAQWDATRFMTLGFAYRSPTTSSMSGETHTRLMDGPDEAVVLAKSEWKTPHMIRFGASFRALSRRLLINLEFRVQFHKRANDEQRFNLCYPNCESSILAQLGLDKIVAPFEWKNVWYPSFGAEYQIAPKWWWRFGASAGRAATPRATVSPFSPPPVWQYGITTGFGVMAGHVRLDLAYQFASGPSAVVTQRNAINCSPIAAAKSGCDGTYSLDSHTIALSATLTR